MCVLVSVRYLCPYLGSYNDIGLYLQQEQNEWLQTHQRVVCAYKLYELAL